MAAPGHHDRRDAGRATKAARWREGAAVLAALAGDRPATRQAQAAGSAHAVGPGLRLQLGADGDAWEMQYRDRFDKNWEPPEPPEPPSSFMWPPA